MTIIGSIGMGDIKALSYVEGVGNTELFSFFIDNYLCPILKPSNVVVMDNVSFHISSQIQSLIEKTGAKLLYSPPYCPELNPVEEMWSKVKTLLRKVCARTKNTFYSSLKSALMSVTQSDLFGCSNMLDI